MKTKTLHRQLHPIHWYASMLVAIAAILVTATKTSSEMARSLRSVTPVSSAVISSLHLRDAETVHSSLVISGPNRHATVSGF